ncbi:MAG: hypothetical protein WBP26_05065 [Candidatus Saccharimonadales bacterium]
MSRPKLSKPQKLTESERRIVSAIESGRQKVDAKFPFGTALGATIGLVMVLYGTEKIIDKTFFADHPISLVITGVIVLFITGAVYRKL